MTLQEAAVIVGLQTITLRKYTTTREPHLRTTWRVVNGHAQHDVTRADLAEWLAQYHARRPFGARLHKNRRIQP